MRLNIKRGQCGCGINKPHTNGSANGSKLGACCASNVLVNVPVAVGSQTWAEVLSTVRTVCMFYLNVLIGAYTGLQ